MAIIDVKDVYKTYTENAVPVHAVNGVSFSVEKGEFIAIVGPSGCGKTTMLNMIGGLDAATKGKIIIEGEDISTLSPAQLVDFRLHNIGFVFQAYNLIPVLTVKENIKFIMELQHKHKKEAEDRVKYLLEILGMKDKIDVRPKYLSGGQQQRVAVARALASKPKFVLADEPTANLDSKSTETLLDLMAKMNKDEEMTFIFSTHDQRVMDRAHRIITLEDGKVIDDSRKMRG
ncbi:MAG: ABC transporter ATP-binding protein [Chitinophagales bacterium]|nr:ABC transporter ATP-binding protein [Chitinophagaceae bacterium]MCB0699747.1 ABC transporter ATP-binding protein [Chitinophagaceae bacterium]MCB9064678.1 ABC transporter ATP-binding protein [Chitinophagales bacterium]